MVVSNDVTIGRNNHSAADAVLHAGLLWHHPLTEKRTEELLHLVVLPGRPRSRSSLLSNSTLEVTATFTIAGVTLAASVSIARSSASNGPTVLSSRADAAGAGTGDAALTIDGLIPANTNNSANTVVTSNGTIKRRCVLFADGV